MAIQTQIDMKEVLSVWLKKNTLKTCNREILLFYFCFAQLNTNFAHFVGLNKMKHNSWFVFSFWPCPFKTSTYTVQWKWEKSKMMSKLKQINSCVDLDNLYIILLSFFSFTLFVNISLLCYCGSFGDVWTW